jgi:isopenicillin N synthase-like dioxygenase
MSQPTGIPVIDVGALASGDDAAYARLARELRAACIDVGFFFLDGHGVPQDVVEGAFDQTRAFHDLPLEAKQGYRINEHNIGYMASRASMQRSSTVHRATRPNLVASFFMKRERAPDDPAVVAGLPLRGPNQWPEELPEFRAAMLAYMSEMEALGRRMLPLFAGALDLERSYFDGFFREPSITLRISRYPAQTGFDGEEFGTGPHTDAGFMTFLAQADVRGLDIQTRDGAWLPAPVRPGMFLVNIGQILSRWTNGLFPATPHRVVNLEGVERHAIPFFFDPDFDAVISCLPTCESDDNPARYPPIRYLDHILAFTNRNFDHRRKSA